ncbi:glycosyltransferase [candidate division KSB1 bacterium]
MKKKVLIISYYFPPIGGAGTLRILKFLKYLPLYGWESHVLTVKKHYSFLHDNSLEKEIPNYKNIYRSYALLIGDLIRKAFKYKPGQKNNKKKNHNEHFKDLFSIAGDMIIFLKNLFYTILFIPDEYIGWLPFGVLKGRDIVKDKEIDVIVSSGPPNTTHIIGLLLQKITGKKWIVDFRDLWNQYYLNYNPYNIGIKNEFDNFLERTIITHADKIIVVSDIMKAQLLAMFPRVSSDKVTVITNGFDSSDFDSIEPYDFKKKFIITHFGTFFKWRNPLNFLKALRNLIDKHDDFREDILFVCIGIVHEHIAEYVDALELNKYVKIVDYKPYYEGLKYLKGSDVFLLITGELAYNKNMLTTKLFDYIGGKKPVIALTGNGALKEFVEEYSLGKTVNNDNINEIECIIYNYYVDIKNGEEIYNPKDCSGFERKVATEKLSEVLNKAVQ